MDTPSKKKNNYKPDVRENVLAAMLEWEAGKKSFDEISKGGLGRLPEKNRPFFTELFRGVLRYRLTLDYKLRQLTDRELEEIPLPILTLLRLAGYQLDFMTIPKPVTVDVSVELAKKYGHPGTVRFVNGILRRWANEPDLPYPDDPNEFLSIRYSHPRWMIDRWLLRFGREKTIQLLEWNNTPPLLTARVNFARISAEEFQEMLGDLGIATVPTSIPGSITLESSMSVEKLPGFGEGLFWIQGSSALLPVYLLDPKPGERILDLCAAPGGKTCQIAEAMENQGELIAVDADAARIEKVEENKRRLGFSMIKTIVGDGLSIQNFVTGAFDGILLDAPCTGTGVFRKKIDARWKKTPEDLQRMHNLQSALLRSASALLKPGGRLVYSTCSLEPEENESVISRFLEQHPNFIIGENSNTEAEFFKEGFLNVTPFDHQMDGFFAARLVKPS